MLEPYTEYHQLRKVSTFGREGRETPILLL